MTDYLQEQEMEIKALEAILMDEFKEIHPSESGLNTSNRCYQITLSPEDDEFDNSVTTPVQLGLIFSHTEKYPYEPPLLNVISLKGIQTGDLKILKDKLEQEASENLGMAMVYTLFSTAKEWLAERFAQDHNDGITEAEERAKDEMDVLSCSSRTRLKSSSQQIALYGDENLLALILLRVPYKQLLYSKSVSKQWRSLITAPHFTCLLRNSIPPLRASGLFIQRPPIFKPLDEVCFVSLDNPNTPSPFRTLTSAHDPFDPEKIRILQSCNGLLLCYTILSRPREFRKYYVCNPSTNHVETLSEHPPGSGLRLRYVGLAFDPSKSIYYKLIAFEITSTSPYVGNFYMYSSETGTWKTSAESFSLPPEADFDNGVYWNGCIHWLSELNSKSEPESTVSDCLCFDVDDERLETFPRPPGVRSTSRNSLYFGESEGHLHFVEACHYDTSLTVYEMKSDYSGWFIKYQIDLDPISKVFPEMTKYKCVIFPDKIVYTFSVLSLIRRENFREDPFLVLEIPGKVIRYNLVSRIVKMIRDFSVDYGLDKIVDRCFGNFCVWQYLESV